MMLQRFDIFLGRYLEEGSYWIDAVAGLETAYQTMFRLAVTKPGPYFIFDASEKACVGIIDTTYRAPN